MLTGCSVDWQLRCPRVNVLQCYPPTWLWEDGPSVPDRFHPLVKPFSSTVHTSLYVPIAFQALANISELKFLLKFIRFSFKFYNLEVVFFFFFFAICWDQQTRKYFWSVFSWGRYPKKLFLDLKKHQLTCSKSSVEHATELWVAD